MQHSVFHAENAGPVNFSDRLRIADVRPSIHFIADDFLRVALKPACALLPLPTRRPDQDEKQSTARNGMDAVTGRYCLKQINRAEGRDLRLYVSKLYRIFLVGPWSTCL